MKNSIEEDIESINKGLYELEDSYELYQAKWAKRIFENIKEKLEHILSDYKRVLKENEELKNKKEKTIKKIGQFSKKAETLPYDYDYLNGVSDVIKIVEENL